MHFFRGKRLYNIQVDKIKTYLKYAFGEIILIMIGIFLGVQLNNWNKNRKDINAAQDYIRGMSYDLRIDSINFQRFFTRVERYNAYRELALRNSLPDSVSASNLLTLFPGTKPNINLYNRSFLRIKNSDIFQLKE